MRTTYPTAAAAPPDPALPEALRLVLLALLILGAAIWIGGMAAVTVLAAVSTKILATADRTALFRAFGRRYLTVAGTALAVTVISGGILLGFRPWDGLATAIVVVTAALVLALAAGVKQARTMGRLRHQAASPSSRTDPHAQRAIDRGARWAVGLRSLIGLLTVAVFALAVCTAA